MFNSFCGHGYLQEDNNRARRLFLPVLYRDYGDGGIVMIIFTSDSRRALFNGYAVIIVVSKIFSNFDDVSSKGIILYFSSLMNSMIAADSFSVGDSILRVRRDRDKNILKVGAGVCYWRLNRTLIVNYLAVETVGVTICYDKLIY